MTDKIFFTPKKEEKTMNKLFFFLFVSLVTVSGCSTYPSLVNYQAEGMVLQEQVISNYIPIKLQVGDILQIEVSSAEADAVAIFKDYQTSGYRLDSNGAIDFPLSGEINLSGKTLDEAKSALQESLRKYFDIQPTLNLSLANFTVTVNGEITNPGIISVQNDRINIIEAIVRSGDFTAYSKRDSVMIVREVDGVRSFSYVNFNSNEIFNSPYFYLRQNDLIYIKPEKRVLGNVRTRQDKLLPYISVGISIILLSFTISRNR